MIFGIIQTAFYLDFAWVYYSRQRIKLRNGGIVDSEDLSRGWLVGKMLGRKDVASDEEQLDGASVSVSADEGVVEGAQRVPQRNRQVLSTPKARGEMAGMLQGDDSDNESNDEIVHSTLASNDGPNVGNGQEWSR